jgi:hypothetical protein
MLHGCMISSTDTWIMLTEKEKPGHDMFSSEKPEAVQAQMDDKLNAEMAALEAKRN